VRELQTDLVLAGHRLRLRSSDPGILADAAAVMTPPCHQADAGAGAPGWSVEIETGTGGPASYDLHNGLPVVSWPQSGRQLAVHRSDGGVIEATGVYRQGAGPTCIEADIAGRRTRVLLPPGDLLSRRWPDWLARSFFGARLLCDGWVLLHASAVRIAAPAGDRAVLVLAGSRGGKSTLAYRACRELGAAHMADDLALARARPDGAVEVTGWPTRACVPVEILDPALLDSIPGDLISRVTAAGRPRARVILRPPQYEQFLGIRRAGPALLGGICLSPAPGGPAAASGLPPGHASRELAAAARIPVQRATMTDLIGLTGAPAAHGPDTGAQELPVDGIPAVGVRIPDMSLLPVLPVWDLIGGRIPGLEARR
jgi:hypothetical protein